MSNFEQIVNHVIIIEGGYSDNKLDSGGKTKYGITEATAREFGYTGSMVDLPRELALLIYKAKFWDSQSLDYFPYAIAYELFDTGINTGISRSGIFLQRSLNVLNKRQELYEDIKVDGQIGQKTVQAYMKYVKARGIEGEAILLKMLNALQGNFYIELAERREKDEEFIYGWFKNRIVI